MSPSAVDSRINVHRYQGDNEGVEDVVKKKGRWWFEFETELIWSNIIGIVGFHLLSLYFIITFEYRKEPVLVLWTFVMCQLSGFGVTGGAHRLWTHRAYKAKLPLRIILAILYASAGMNPIYDWVRDHRVHHKYTETDADPHNSKRGFWFSHVGWLMMKKHPEVHRRGRGLDMSDVEADPVVMFVDRHFILFKIIFCFVVPVLIPVYVFNQNWRASIISELFIRYPIVLNGTWSVNSFAHIWGYRTYDKSIKPTENFIVAIVSVGEGWHNYHHVFPWDYKAAEFGNLLLNPTTAWLDLLAKIGWAYDLREASADLVRKITVHRGDGSHHLHSYYKSASDRRKSPERSTRQMTKYIIHKIIKLSEFSNVTSHRWSESEVFIADKGHNTTQLEIFELVFHANVEVPQFNFYTKSSMRIVLKRPHSLVFRYKLCCPTPQTQDHARWGAFAFTRLSILPVVAAAESMTVSDLKNRALPAEAAPIETKVPKDVSPDDSKSIKDDKKPEGWFQFKTDLVWPNIFGFGLWHLITFYYLITFPYLQYKGLMLWAFIMAEFNLLSITAGVHRLWCHRSYKAKTPLRIFLAIFFLATGENRISHWVREHRVHHKYTDTDADPHNSKRGLFFSHIGWQMMKKHPDVITKGRTINYDDLRADPVVVFFDRHFAFFKTLFCFVLPVFIPVYFFGQELKPAIITQWFMRYPYVVNIMFSVNSFAHAFGYRSYDRTIRPTENGIISMVTTGEGWHNYHHAFPWDYKAAELGTIFFNRCTWWINVWAKMGLAYDLKEVGEHSVKRIVERKGDGSHPVWSTKDASTPMEEAEEHPY
ncbi:uncharacterized protein LOC135162609 [Diachasmimorpha longicaudata]|uniref:uncharacterized protein LOC135162609 n=1 Tax=Diachasmimorpha longicaudata TaxID=58733 RepID=UPI0030B8E84B